MEEQEPVKHQVAPADRLPAGPGTRSRKRSSNAALFAAAAIAVPGMLLAAWLGDDGLGRVNIGVRHRALLIGAAVTLLPAFGLGLWARRSAPAGSAARSVRLGAVAGAAIAFWMLLGFGLEWANRHFDTSRPFVTEWKVLELDDSTRKSSNAVLQLLDGDEHPTATIPIGNELADQVVPGLSRLAFTHRKGAFGWSYFASIDLLPERAGVVEAARVAALQARASDETTHPLSTAQVMAIAIGFPLGIVAILTGIMFFFVQLQRRTAKALGGRIRGLSISVRRHGLDFRIFDGWLRIGQPAARTYLTALPRDWLASLAERLAFSRPVLSGDPEFDAAILVESAPPDVARTLLASPEARRLIQNLIESAPNPARAVLRLDEDGMRIRCPLTKQPAEQTSRSIDQLAALHDVIATRVQPVVGSHRIFPRGTVRKLKVAAAVIACAGLACFVLAVIGMTGRTLDAAMRGILAWCLSLSLITLPATLWLVHVRRSGAQAASLALVATPAITFCFALFGVLAGNTALDASPDRLIRTRLLGFDGSGCVVAAWEPGPADVRLQFAPPGSGSLAPPCDVMLRMRDGAFGFPRVIGIEAAEH